MAAVFMVRMEPTADASLAAMRDRSRLGIAMAAIIKMMATTISNSISEKPFSLLIMIYLSPWRNSPKFLSYSLAGYAAINCKEGANLSRSVNRLGTRIGYLVVSLGCSLLFLGFPVKLRTDSLKFPQGLTIFGSPE